MGSTRRVGSDFLPRDWGVDKELKVGLSPIETPSSDGTDSLDLVLLERTDSKPFSLPRASSSNKSSGGLSSKSIGLFGSEKVSNFSDAVC